MKLKILSAIAISGLATGAFGQQLLLDNGHNTAGIGATSGGLVFEQGTATGGAAELFNSFGANAGLNDVGVTVSFGTSSSSLSVFGTYTPATDAKGYTGTGNGIFQLGAAGLPVTPVGAVAGGAIWVELQLWDYDTPGIGVAAQSYADALTGNAYVGTVLFQQTGLSNPVGSPPTPAPDLTGMPSITLMQQVPEPATFALAGLGLASLLAFRRRK